MHLVATRQRPILCMFFVWARFCTYHNWILNHTLAQSKLASWICWVEGEIEEKDAKKRQWNVMKLINCTCLQNACFRTPDVSLPRNVLANMSIVCTICVSIFNTENDSSLSPKMWPIRFLLHCSHSYAQFILRIKGTSNKTDPKFWANFGIDIFLERNAQVNSKGSDLSLTKNVVHRKNVKNNIWMSFMAWAILNQLFVTRAIFPWIFHHFFLPMSRIVCIFLNM